MITSPRIFPAVLLYMQALGLPATIPSDIEEALLVHTSISRLGWSR
jgi:hypothetical protein